MFIRVVFKKIRVSYIILVAVKMRSNAKSKIANTLYCNAFKIFRNHSFPMMTQGLYSLVLWSARVYISIWVLAMCHVAADTRCGIATMTLSDSARPTPVKVDSLCACAASYRQTPACSARLGGAQQSGGQRFDRDAVAFCREGQQAG